MMQRTGPCPTPRPFAPGSLLLVFVAVVLAPGLQAQAPSLAESISGVYSLEATSLPDGGISLTWRSSPDDKKIGAFRISREEYVLDSSARIVQEHVPFKAIRILGAGSSPAMKSYRFIDEDLRPGTLYCYRITATYAGESFIASDVACAWQKAEPHEDEGIGASLGATPCPRGSLSESTPCLVSSDRLARLVVQARWVQDRDTYDGKIVPRSARLVLVNSADPQALESYKHEAWQRESRTRKEGERLSFFTFSEIIPVTADGTWIAVFSDGGFENNANVLLVGEQRGDRIAIQGILDHVLSVSIGGLTIEEVTPVGSRGYLLRGQTSGGDEEQAWGTLWFGLWRRPSSFEMLHREPYRHSEDFEETLEYIPGAEPWTFEIRKRSRKRGDSTWTVERIFVDLRSEIFE